jgi:pyridoxine 5-phosphate synthase
MNQNTSSSQFRSLRLGVNIDHVATIRNARGGSHPDPVQAALLAAKAGADGITAHLREDRRHISDEDIGNLLKLSELPLNLEMAMTDEMLEIALRNCPNACCLVPERRMELTTEGGLNVALASARLAVFTSRLRDAGIRVSLFIDCDQEQISAAHQAGADIVELHTGRYCHLAQEEDIAGTAEALDRLRSGAAQAFSLGLEVHAGHGLTFGTVGPVASIMEVVELNIGHFLIGESIFCGLDSAIRRMRAIMDSCCFQSLGQHGN